MRKLIILAVVVMAITMACATAYTSGGLFGGYEDTQLSEDTFRVSFQGNGYTSEDRTTNFIFRRCAEITLEEGCRYFVMEGQETDSDLGGYFSGSFWSRPSGDAVFTVVEEDVPGAYDAVFVIRETDAQAGGNLSEKARATLNSFR